MPRSRSRSPRRDKTDRKRSRSRSKDRDRERHRRRRSRSKDKGRKRSRSRDRSRRDDRGHREREHGGHRSSNSGRGGPGQQRIVVSDSDDEMLIFEEANKAVATEEEIQEMPAEDQDIMRIMGFKGFDTTKDKQVVGNDHYAANICKKRRYRQYMNRKGGFNRPLDSIA